MRNPIQRLSQVLFAVSLVALPAIGLSQTVTDFGFSPEIVAGGKTSTGELKLSKAAPAAGFVVKLSSNESFAQVPASVTVAAGAKSVTFTVTTTAVTKNEVATILAIDPNGKKAKADLGVTAPFVLKLLAVAVDQPVVLGGKTITGGVLLNGKAPAAGFVVTLTSDQKFLQVPATVTISEGLAAASFKVTTTAVTENSTATITAEDPNGVKSTVKVVVAAPVVPKVVGLAFKPAIVVGGKSATGEVSLDAEAPTGGIVITLSSNESYATVPASVTVKAGEKTATFTVSTTTVTKSGIATITAKDPNGKTVTQKLGVAK